MKLKNNLASIPPYVAGVKKKGAIKLSSNENPVGPSPRALAALIREAETLNVYPESSYDTLRKELARFLHISPDELIVGNGSDDIMLFAAAAYVGKGDNAITSQGTFSTYGFVTRLFEGVMRYAPMKEYGFDLDAIGSMVDKRTRIVYLCNPNSPTGTYFTGKALTKFLKGISREVLVIVDEAYMQYVTAKDYPQTLKLIRRFSNILILRTFSKVYGLAGLRIGLGIGKKEVIADLNRARLPFNVNSLAQAAAIAGINDIAFTKKMQAINEEGKAYLYREFEKLGLFYVKTQSNFIFVELKKDAKEVFKKIMSLGVTIRPLTSFGFKTAIRVTVGTMKQNRKFIACLKKAI